MTSAPTHPGPTITAARDLTRTRRPLPVAHEEVLRALVDARDEATVGEVSTTLYARPSTVRRRLQDLVERGWVTRHSRHRTSNDRAVPVIAYRATLAGTRCAHANEPW